MTKKNESKQPLFYKQYFTHMQTGHVCMSMYKDPYILEKVVQMPEKLFLLIHPTYDLPYEFESRVYMIGIGERIKHKGYHRITRPDGGGQVPCEYPWKDGNKYFDLIDFHKEINYYNAQDQNDPIKKNCFRDFGEFGDQLHIWSERKMRFIFSRKWFLNYAKDYKGLPDDYFYRKYDAEQGHYVYKKDFTIEKIEDKKLEEKIAGYIKNVEKIFSDYQQRKIED